MNVYQKVIFSKVKLSVNVGDATVTLADKTITLKQTSCRPFWPLNTKQKKYCYNEHANCCLFKNERRPIRLPEIAELSFQKSSFWCMKYFMEAKFHIMLKKVDFVI